MTGSDESTESTEKSYAERYTEALASGEVLGVLTGQVPVRSMPVAGQYTGEPRALDGEFIEDDEGSQ